MNTQEIRKQADVVDAVAKELSGIDTAIAKAKGIFGQDTTASVRVNGVEFGFLEMNRAYQPQVRKGMETIQAEAVRLLEARRNEIESRLEGAKWKLVQLAKQAN